MTCHKYFKVLLNIWKPCGSGQPQSVARCDFFAMLVCVGGSNYRPWNLSKHDMQCKEAERAEA